MYSMTIYDIFQIFGRNLMLFVIVLPEERLHDEPLVWWLFVVWSAIEIIRSENLKLWEMF